MYKILKIITLFIISVGFLFNIGISNTSASSLYGDKTEDIGYCSGDSCGVNKGVGLVKNSGIDGMNTNSTASNQVQKIIEYLLTFITLIAVIYIIYAGFRILVSNGDDDTLKKSKNTIIYVIVGILVIWFAWGIAVFAVSIGGKVG